MAESSVHDFSPPHPTSPHRHTNGFDMIAMVASSGLDLERYACSWKKRKFWGQFGNPRPLRHSQPATGVSRRSDDQSKSELALVTYPCQASRIPLGS